MIDSYLNVPKVIKPHEERVRTILLNAGFGEVTTNDFIENYFLLKVFSEDGDLHIEFIYHRKLAAEITDNVKRLFIEEFGAFTQVNFTEDELKVINLRR